MRGDLAKEVMKLSVIVLTKNEEKWLPGCLNSACQLADEIIVIDDQSTDRTTVIAKKYGAKVFVQQKKGFAAQREFGLSKAQGDWVLYLDADERVTGALREEILAIITTPRRCGLPVAYYIKRQNIFLGREQKQDKVEKLFKKEVLLGWQGVIHESPKVKGSKGILKNPLIHLTHRDIESMTKKTLEWSKIEAKLLDEAGHPKVTSWRLLWAMKRELKRQVLINRVWRYGLEGWFEGIFQVFSCFITYVRLWERQRGESLDSTYEKIDQKFR